MQKTWFKREVADGLEWCSVKVSNVELDFESDIAELDLQAEKTYAISWRMVNLHKKGAGKLTVWKSNAGATGPWIKLFQEQLPATANTYANFTIFDA